jgi:Domain of unknown function (DUF1864)
MQNCTEGVRRQPTSVANALATIGHTDHRTPPPYEAVQALDPLGLDRFLKALPELTENGRLEPILTMLTRAVHGADATALRKPEVAIAALRDLDFLISSAHRIAPGSYKRVTGLELLLDDLGRWADHTPRGCNFTYSLCNPPGERMRRFTTSGEETRFIHAIQEGTGDLDKILVALDTMTGRPVDDIAFTATASLLAGWFDHMATASRSMMRSMPPDVFNRRIVVFFGALDINGRSYPGITGAQTHNCAIDYLLFGADSSDPAYLDYATSNLAALSPFHRCLLRGGLERLGGTSLLGRIGADLRRGDLDRSTTAASLQHLDRFVTAILSFRAVHRRLALAQLTIRPSGKGSGGFDLALLDLLIRYTRDARDRVRAMQASVATTAGGS